LSIAFELEGIYIDLDEESEGEYVPVLDLDI